MHPSHALAAGEYDSDSRLDFAKRILTDAKNDGGVHSGTGKEVMLFWENEGRAGDITRLSGLIFGLLLPVIRTVLIRAGMMPDPYELLKV